MAVVPQFGVCAPNCARFATRTCRETQSTSANFGASLADDDHDRHGGHHAAIKAAGNDSTLYFPPDVQRALGERPLRSVTACRLWAKAPACHS